MNLPNKLTMLRIVLVPVFVVCFYLPINGAMYIAAAVFVIAYFTDLLDGHIARKRGLITDFGKLMDPMADKLLTAAAMIMLTAYGLCSPIATFVTIGRELVISAFRLVSATQGVVIAAGKIGKLKTLTQFIGIVLILLGNPLFNQIGVPLDQIMIWIPVVLAVWSCTDYIVKNLKALHFN